MSLRLFGIRLFTLLMFNDRLDKHGVGTETLPEEAGVPSLLDALEASNAIEPHSLPLIDVSSSLDLVPMVTWAQFTGAD